MPAQDICQIHISLDSIEPSIWRRILVPGDCTLLDLHFLIQTAMGWTNSHLHAFRIAGKEYSLPPEEIYPDDVEILDDSLYRLNQFNLSAGDCIPYVYDFGDNWQHTILIEEIRKAGQESVPACLDGSRSCPPEDVGSTDGFEEFLRIIADPDHPEHESCLAWAGGSFDPEAFNLTETDQALRSIETSEMMRVHLRYEPTEQGPRLIRYDRVARWEQGLSTADRGRLEALPLRRDFVSTLTWLQEHPTKTTATLGNFPLKAIREIAALMVNPPLLEEKVGDRVFTYRREYEVPPIQFIHYLLDMGGLLLSSTGKKLTLTPRGEQFLRTDPPLQVWFLLETWWYHTNWMFMYDIEYLGVRMDDHLVYSILYQLLSLPADESIPFDTLADHLLEKIHWSLHADPVGRLTTLRHFIERVVLHVLSDFGIMHLEFPPDPKAARFLLPITGTLTGHGKNLLGTLAL